jgi:hypothetical protein
MGEAAARFREWTEVVAAASGDGEQTLGLGIMWL